MASDAQKVIATAGLISVAVGSANSFVKYKKPPSTRFLIGSGMAYLLLSSLGNMDAMSEIAKGLAVGVMSTIVLGEGGGVMSYFVGLEGDTKAPKAKSADPAQRAKAQQSAVHLIAHPQPTTPGAYRSDRFTPQPFLPGTGQRITVQPNGVTQEGN